MALVRGTNCGFVTVAPVADPTGADDDLIDTKAFAFKDTAPVGAAKIVEIGWWCNNATEAANTQVGIYSDDSNEPNVLLGTSGDFAKGTTAGWKVATGLNIPITASTIYWLAAQLDDTATLTWIDREWIGAGNAVRRKDAQTSLPSPWGASNWGTNYYVYAIYAVWEEVEVGTNMKVNIADVFKDILELKINILNAWKNVIKIQQNIGDDWKTVFG